MVNKVIMVDFIYEIGLDIYFVNLGIIVFDYFLFWDEGYFVIVIVEEYDNDFNFFWYFIFDFLG